MLNNAAMHRFVFSPRVGMTAQIDMSPTFPGIQSVRCCLVLLFRSLMSLLRLTWTAICPKTASAVFRYRLLSFFLFASEVQRIPIDLTKIVYNTPYRESQGEFIKIRAVYFINSMDRRPAPVHPIRTRFIFEPRRGFFLLSTQKSRPRRNDFSAI